MGKLTAESLKGYLEQVVDQNILGQITSKAMGDGLNEMANALNQPLQPERTTARGR